MARHRISARQQPGVNGHQFSAEHDGQPNRRGRVGSWAGAGRNGPIRIDRVTAVLAVITCLLLGAGVADISHSLVLAIMAAGAITAGIIVTLVILRPSC